MAQLGNNILVYLNGSAIAGTKVNDIQIDCETIEITNTSSAQWRKFIAGRKTWTVSTSFIVLASDDIKKVLESGTIFTLQIRDRQGSAILQGQAILKTSKMSFPKSALATGSISFQGSDELHILQ